MLRLLLAMTYSLLPMPLTSAEEPLSAIARYGKLDIPQITKMFDDRDDGWRDRVSPEFEIINDADLASLRAALKDRKPVVRAMAA